MKKIILFLVAIIFLSTQFAFSNDYIIPVRNKKKHESKKQRVILTPIPTLYDKIPMTDKRYSTFDLAFRIMEKRKVNIIVETGTDRSGVGGCVGDGCSTLMFGEWAKLHNAQVFSVDIDPNAIAAAEKAVRSINPSVAFYCMDSISFLEQFDQVI